MDDIKQTVTRTQESAVTPTGAVVDQETKQVQTKTATSSSAVFSNIVWYILGLVETLLGLRLLLKLLGANPSSGFVDFIYSVTNVLTAPFDNIFNVAKVDSTQVHSIFEPSIIVAMVVYALIAYGLRKLLSINKRDA